MEKTLNAAFPFFVAGLLISDFATSMVFKLSISSFYRYAGAFKLTAEALMLIGIIVRFKKPQMIHKVFVAVILSFILGQFVTNFREYNLFFHFSKGNIYYLNRYLYILLFIIFINYVKIEKKTYLKTYSVFEAILLFNCLMIFLGMLFKIDIFKSYEYTLRLGYVGLFSKPEEAAYLYCIAIIYNYYSWVNKYQFMKLFKLVLFSLTILMLGQKKMYLFLALMVIMYLIYENRYKIYFRYIIPVVILAAFFFRVEIFHQLIQRMPFWKKLYDENGVLAVVTSYRNVLVQKAYAHINTQWEFVNYFFGSLDFGKYKVEFEILDLYIFVGISGLLLYYYILRHHFFNSKDILKNRLVLIIFLTSFFSGGLLLSVTATLILYFVSNKIMTKKTQ